MSFKAYIRKFPLYQKMRKWDAARRQKGRDEVADWERKGCPVPPPHLVKQREIKTLAEEYGVKVFIETGTLYGDMIEAMKPYFDQLYSIELSESLYERACERFSGEDKVRIIQGDSAVELGKLMSEITGPAMFWLDGHYSAGDTARGVKDTPIYEELNDIFNHSPNGHVIMIDDAHCFESDPAYPSLDEIRGFILGQCPDVTVEVKCSSIRILPAKQSA